jgi:VCBS repeat-containing protein
VIPAGEGAARVLKVGDTVQSGDAVLTGFGTNLVITDTSGNPWAPRDLILALAEANASPTPVTKSGKSLQAKIKGTLAGKEALTDKDTDQTIQAVELGDEDAAPAAGGGAGGSGSMTPGLRVDRVIEVVTSQEFVYGSDDRQRAEPSDETQNQLLESAVADAVAKLTATDDIFTTHTGTVVGLPVLANDGIAAASAPLVTAINGQAISPGGQVVLDHGVVQMSSTGALTFAPTNGFLGDQTFTYTVTDASGQTADASVTISVITPPDLPIATPDLLTTQEDTAVTFNVTGNDDAGAKGPIQINEINGQIVVPGASVPVANGSVTLNADGTLTITPNADYVGNISFAYTVADLAGQTANATVTVQVNAVNDAPVIEGSGVIDVTTAEDKPVSGKVNATDADGDSLTFDKGSDPAHGSVAVNPDGTWTYTPTPNYNGSDSFTVTVSDGKGCSSQVTINVGITPVADAPVIGDTTDPTFNPSTGNYTVSTDEDQPVSGTVTATDPDGDTVTFTKGSDPANGVVTVNPDGTWTYTPGPDYNGGDSFTVTVSDGHGGTTPRR